MPTHRVGIGVAGVDEIPLRFVQRSSLQPFKLEALPGHLLAFLAHLFALARSEHVEKVLKVAIATILPVILTANALQPARLFGHGGVGERIGEIDVGTGKRFYFQITGQALEQLKTVLDPGGQQPRPTDGTERHRRQKLGVVIDSGAGTGIGPAMIEHVLAVGMPLAITGQRRDQPIVFDVQQMLRLPTGVGADAAAVFQCTEKRMAQKGLIVRHQCVPGM
ncbi:hypothetical protein PS732_03247 [Pseudomonas fluorescens]|uniref:Uncharacterized protein n=1 Tax=Pseudomonas fluorescens TaxID=294 RepID=A0ABD7VHW4_PSEFL|nr:hypothetical protein PS732_03247 [Pseudomonas fluorescens]